MTRLVLFFLERKLRRYWQPSPFTSFRLNKRFDISTGSRSSPMRAYLAAINLVNSAGFNKPSPSASAALKCFVCEGVNFEFEVGVNSSALEATTSETDSTCCDEWPAECTTGTACSATLALNCSHPTEWPTDAVVEHAKRIMPQGQQLYVCFSLDNSLIYICVYGSAARYYEITQ